MDRHNDGVAVIDPSPDVEFRRKAERVENVGFGEILWIVLFAGGLAAPRAPHEHDWSWTAIPLQGV
ncbi:hypothetical protein J2129_002034 [Methanofollis sp. W23]|uniref:hypothetical protein n=1 Tax=Methanofollis sp. W23 TaxID=2817849 RepID=UPI001AE62036|nr:hypothetical protein [Methanofollis sp. W23]MBP2146580.1 hypothetical protein [Methanofollis sp. W23]